MKSAPSADAVANAKREAVLPDSGPAAPPRSNGELVFEVPWQSRIFGVTMALHEAGRFAWPEFQTRLIAAIADHERRLEAASGGGAEGSYDYYGCWLEAFRTLATDKRWLAPGALDALERELFARPPGHDHHHA